MPKPLSKHDYAESLRLYALHNAATLTGDEINGIIREIQTIKRMSNREYIEYCASLYRATQPIATQQSLF